MRTYECTIDLYRGDLCLVSNTQALILCEALRAQYLTLLARLADHYFEPCHYAECLGYACACSRRIRAHRAIMRCYVRQGARAQALHQYRVYSAILRREFNMAPEPATEALYRQIQFNPDTV